MGAGWQVVSPATPGPVPRSQDGMAADEQGHLYLYGGNTSQDPPLGDFWCFDTATASWQALPSGLVPPLIEPHLAIDAQGNVWEFGGIAQPGAPHLSDDGHSYGLYEYQPATFTWRDMTPTDAAPGLDWPPGREDHGFAFDSQANDLVVFAGEGQDDVVLNDMWTYDEQAGTWTQVAQQYAAPGGAVIAPREIYNISADTQGHLYLFGGAYLPPPFGDGSIAYANDLWRYDDSTQTWSLLAGIANHYDPSQPLPRHYYGQSVDPLGDFDILGGYLYAPEPSPFFAQDAYAAYAVPMQFAALPLPGTYALTDFWQFDPGSGWRDRSDLLGVLAGSPMIPYVMVFDQATNQFYTFGGSRLGQDGLMDTSNSLWSLDSDDLAAPTSTPTPSSTASPDLPPGATATPSATAVATVRRTPTPGVTPAVSTLGTHTTARPINDSTLTKTLHAGPYKLTLVVSAPQALYSPSQALAQHPLAGEVVLRGSQPHSPGHAGGPAPNRHIEVAVYSASTGKPDLNLPVAMTVTTAAGAVLQHVPVLLLQRLAKGPDPWHFGNNLALPKGHYHIVVRAGRTGVTFDVLLGA